MRISTRARYGLRFMLELAAQVAHGPVFLKDIAKSQEISEKYLSQIVIDLKSARLIDAIRGAHGGYVLTRKPEDITVKDVVGTLEGDLCLVECGRDPKSCKRSAGCVSQEVWQKLGEVMSETLASITLNDLLNRRQQKSQEQAMYYI